MKLKSDTLYLTDFTPEHITAEYIQWLNDPVVTRYSNQRFVEHTPESCRAYLDSFAQTDNRFWAIHLLEDDRHIGTMTHYISQPHGTADMGILIGDPGVWGKGMGKQAWNASIRHLFDSGMRKVTAGTLACNTGMVKIMEGCGMHWEATRHKQEMLDDRPEDIVYYAKFRD